MLLDSCKRNLTYILLAGKGVQGLMDEAFRVLNCPLHLESIHYEIIAQVPGTYKPKTIQHSTHKYAINHKGNTIAYLIFDGTCKQPIEFTNLYAEMFCQYLSIELSKSNITAAHKSHYEYFIAKILNTPITDAVAIAKMIKKYDIPSCPEYRLILIDSNNYELLSNLDRMLKYNSMFYKSTVYNNNILLIIDSSNKIFTKGPEAVLFCHILKKYSCTAGVSLKFEDYNELHSRYKQSVKVFTLNKNSFKKQDVFVFYDDYTITDMLNCYSRYYSISELIHPAYAALLEYDRTYNSEFAKTLKVYLTEKGNNMQIAAALHIHQNTLLYRLNKIKEIIDMDINNENDKFALMLAIEIGEQHVH